MKDEYEFDLFWHALNYRGAQITLKGNGAQEAWEQLEACVNRLIARERAECAKEAEWRGKEGENIAAAIESRDAVWRKS